MSNGIKAFLALFIFGILFGSAWLHNYQVDREEMLYRYYQNYDNVRIAKINEIDEETREILLHIEPFKPREYIRIIQRNPIED
jgi:hypothetical protein